ncbi:uncharacterized protein LOC133186138 isoform X1 [Saccostrea echinata]|uniref:uncharacterized protein LOC133186138 isoform X1 n=1 Tax=Saccostrea echinata TaxID=191078 RepID=UPI002A7EDB59|nr:uncharacterized protein LOC133186138 isoform X1 [Saccostrea echinata]
MSLAFDVSGPTHRLSRQATTIEVFRHSHLVPFRRHHSSLDLLQLTRESKDGKIPTSSRTVDGTAMGVVKKKPSQKLTGYSSNSNSRPGSENSEDDKAENKTPRKFPILGPTRQQAEFYFKQKNKELQGLTLNSGSSSEHGKHLNTSEKALLDSNDEVEKLRASFASLTTTSLGHQNSQSFNDVRFLAELVKPMQYRLKLNKRKEKVIFPSKYGYHPRSHSPTFKRLIQATEKLETIAKEENEELRAKAELERSYTIHSTSGFENPLKREVRRYGTYKLSVPETFVRNNVSEVPSPKVEPVVLPISKGLQIPQEYPPKEPLVEEDIEEEEDEQDDEDDYISEEEITSEAYFKVDFRVNDGSHAQLHLFLPKINDVDNESRTARYGSGSVKNEVKKTGKLPHISNSQSSGSNRNPNVRRSRKPDVTRKKKRRLERIRSAADNDHRRVRDHLNDVATMMSIEQDFHNKKHEHDSLCQFENCPYHSIPKNNITVS